MQAITTTYIALGSNLNNPVEQLRRAIAALAKLPHSELGKISSFYQNPPHGPPQPDFINAVVEIHTRLSPHELLNALHVIEQQQGRVRSAERNGPRTLDLDIILYGDVIIHDEKLTLPHPRLLQRPFVLIPLVEIAPDLVLLDGKLLKECIRDEDYRHLKVME